MADYVGQSNGLSPANSAGNENDTFTDINSGNVYIKSSGIWSLLGISEGRDSAARRAAAFMSKLSRRNRRYLHLDTLSQWAATPGSGNTITSAADVATARGEVITSTLTTGNGANGNVLKALSPQNFSWGAGANPWFATIELNVALGGYATMTGSDNGTPSNLWYIQFGLGDNTISVNTTGSGLGTTVHAPPNWNMSQWCRLTVIVTPSAVNSTTGTVRYRLHYKDTASLTEAQYVIADQPYSSGVLPTQIIVKHGFTMSAGAAQFARLRVYELYGVTLGCSVDAGYVGWCSDPNTGRTFSANTYNEDRNPAWLLAKELNGDGDYFLNHARGGFSVAQMLAGQAAWATDFKPKLLVIGSATNSLATAQATLSGAAQSAYIATAKENYLTMVQTALAAGSIVICQGVAPRSDATITGAPGGQLGFKTLALDWNSWMAATLKPLGASVCDVYSALEDPANLGALAPQYDGADRVHFSQSAQRLVARKQAESQFL